MRRHGAVVSSVAVVLGAVAGVRASEFWAVRDGTTTITFDRSALRELGLRVTAPTSDDGGPVIELPIVPGSSMTFAVNNGALAGVVDGHIAHAGGLQLITGGATLTLGDVVLQPLTAAGPALSWQGLLLTDAVTGEAGGLVLGEMRAGFDHAAQQVIIYGVEVRISKGSAQVLGSEKLTQRVIGSAVVRASVDWIGGDAPYVPPDPPEVTIGPDMTFCQLYGLAQYGRVGDIVGLSLATTSWNVGDQNLLWFQSPDNRHPFIIMNLYRLKNDRFEQIGQSWVKHGFYALSSSQCVASPPGSCQPTNGTYLGVGCTDTYSAGLNASQGGLGPRYEVNPWTGNWQYSGSLFQTGGLTNTAITRRLQVHDVDLDPAQNAGALYYAEGYYVCLDDVNVMNSASWKPATVSGSPGGTWTFGMSSAGTAPTSGFAVDAWSGAQKTTMAQQVPVVEFGSPDGRCILGAKATDNGNGTWHYEYALLNIDMDRQVGSFSIPIQSGTVVTNVGFHAVEHHNEPAYANSAWTSQVTSTAVTWNTTNNPVRWGTLYNFRFDANRPPAGATATLGMFKPGAPSTVSGQTTGPSGGIVDCNNNGVADATDIANGTSQDCNGNGVPDECEPDCDNDGIPDTCDTPGDCNGNGVRDHCDIANGTSNDVNGNGIPDECEADCNGNGIPDATDIANGTSQDCNNNGVPDECETGGTKSYNITVSPPLSIPDGTGVFVSNTFSVPDHGTVQDLNLAVNIAHTWNGDLKVRLTHGGVTVMVIDRPGYTSSGFGFDNNGFNVVLDDEGTGGSIENVNVASGVVSPPSYTPNNALSAFDGQDKFGAWVIEAGDFAGSDVGTLNSWLLQLTNNGTIVGPCITDCNNNGIADATDIANGTSLDCNGNGVPDECDIAAGASRDCDNTGIPDECEAIPAGHSLRTLNPALSIPDNNLTGVSDTLTVAEHGTITDIDVTVLIDHTYNGDLSVRLTHVETGTNVLVIDRIGQPAAGANGYNSDGFDVVLSDEYPNPIEDANVGDGNRVIGNFRPSPGPLTAFDGQDKYGTWRLTVVDQAGQDVGVLRAWSLRVQANTAFADCNNNGAADLCDITAGAADCDGGPVGIYADGAARFGSLCINCHGADGSGGLGPNIRGKTRVQIWNKLLPPTDHLEHPEYTQQDYANLEAFLSLTGHSGGRPDLTPDSCQTLADCNNNGVADGCDLAAGTSVDANYDGVPDECAACQTNADCDDGNFCNGAEICQAGACVAGADPCAGLFCREDLNACVECLNAGHCDDGVFCNGAEWCDANGNCQPGTDPCAALGLLCNESTDQCVECLANADCDDGAFCNGQEFCDGAGNCQAGTPPCGAYPCNEATDQCQSPKVWLTFASATNVPGIGIVENEDIVAYDLGSGAWSLIFDGSDVGLAALAIDGMEVTPSGGILLSFTAAGTVAGLTGGPGGSTTVDDSDIILFTPTSLGANTAGTKSFYFDGSDVGLTTDNEDVDAIALAADGRLIISLLGAGAVNGVSTVEDEDLLIFSHTSLGASTAGTFAFHFDGSDVGLASNSNEDVDAASRTSAGKLLLSTVGGFTVPGVSGSNEDVFQFTPTTTGTTTSGSYTLLLDLSALGIDPGADVSGVAWVE